MEAGAQGREEARYIGNGGVGGGKQGTNGTYYNGNSSTTYVGKGGTQSAGGAGGAYASYPGEAGLFGIGGNAGRYNNISMCGSGGRGPEAGMEVEVGAYSYAGGGGGSGFVWTSTSSKLPLGYSVPAKYYLSNAQTLTGNDSIPSYDGNTTMIGNSGDGQAKISYIKT